MAILGIDLGTGSAKAAVVEDDGTVRDLASRPYAVMSPNPGWAQSDPAEWLAAVRSIAGDLLDRHRDVTAVSFSGQMHGVVLTGADGAALGPAILWADARSSAQAHALAETIGPAGLARLGSPAVPGFAATTVRWLADHEAERLGAARQVLQPKDYLRVALGGELATEPSDASGTLLYDIVAGHWDDEAIAWAGLQRGMLPQLRASESAAGTVRIGGHELPCAVGGADTACALAGLGLRPGDGFVAVGTGSQIVSVLADPRVGTGPLTTHTFATVGAPGLGWYRIGAVQNAGLALEPALAMLGATAAEATAALEQGVQASDPIFVPYLAGERTPFMDASLRGAWLELSLATDRSALLRSVLEGIAQAVAFGIAAVEESGTHLPEVVPLIGGGTHAPAFRQLLADASGHALGVVDAPDAAVVGAAMLAAGRTVADSRVPVTSVLEPNSATSTLLADRRARIRAWIDAS